MLRWLWYLLWGYQPPKTPPIAKRVLAMEEAIEALTARVNARYDELRTLQGKVAAMKRWSNSQEPEGIDEPAPDDKLQPKPVPPSTEHLAKRFRGF